MTKLTLLAKFPIGEAELARALVLVTAAVIREERVPAGGLRGLGPIVAEPGASAQKAHHGLQKVLNRAEEVEAPKLSGGQGEGEGGHKEAAGDPHVETVLERLRHSVSG